jgi:hypothetical protein
MFLYISSTLIQNTGTYVLLPEINYMHGSVVRSKVIFIISLNETHKFNTLWGVKFSETFHYTVHTIGTSNKIIYILY